MHNVISHVFLFCHYIMLGIYEIVSDSDIDELKLHMQEAGGMYPNRVNVYLMDKGQVIEFSKVINQDEYTVVKREGGVGPVLGTTTMLAKDLIPQLQRYMNPQAGGRRRRNTRRLRNSRKRKNTRRNR